MTKLKREELRDRYATAAMQALIGKMPLSCVGVEGQVQHSEHKRFKLIVANGAFIYADAMLKVRGLYE